VSGRWFAYFDRGRCAVVHLHWPHWATQMIIDVEHQGPLQVIGFVFAVTLMIAAFLLAVFMLRLESFGGLH
jgi:hypothetical protein